MSGSQSGKWSDAVFKARHARIKNILSDILERREKKSGNGAVIELINELEHIGGSREEWLGVDKKETDYLRFILHGIREAPEESSEHY